MFLQILPSELLSQIERWDELKRWERREIGQDLRRMGLSFREISAVIPVAQGTLSGWCADVVLTPDQQRRLDEIRPRLTKRSEIGAARRMKTRAHRAAVRNRARLDARDMLGDPDWIAGVVS